jgi:tetratricopeptide (TPR) repeat protein
MKSAYINFNMRKSLILQILLVLFLLTSYAATSYGQGKFSQYYNKGIEYYKEGKYDQAGKEFGKALELKPNHVYAMYGLGNTYYCKAKYDEAVKTYIKAIKLNPDYPKVHYSLSLAYSKLGMTRDAEKEKEIFRKLTQGGKDVVKTPKKRRIETTSTAKKNDRIVKTRKKTLQVEKPKETKREEVKLQQEEIIKKLKEKELVERKSAKADESHSIFKGYTKETRKVKPRVFVKKKKYKEKSYNPIIKLWAYIQEKWGTSGIYKILICTCGYIFATQMWLCIVAFFGLIIWKIRKQAE